MQFAKPASKKGAVKGGMVGRLVRGQTNNGVCKALTEVKTKKTTQMLTIILTDD